MIADCIDRNLVLVGNVPKRVAYLKEYVEQHNLSGRVIFTGFVDGKQGKRTEYDYGKICKDDGKHFT